MRGAALRLAAVAATLLMAAAQLDAAAPPGAPAPIAPGPGALAAGPPAAGQAAAPPAACGEPGGPCSAPLNNQFTDEQRALMPPCAPGYDGGCAPGFFCINHFSHDAPPRCDPAPPGCGALGATCCPGSVGCGPGLACNAGGGPYFSVGNSECIPLEACGAEGQACCQPLGHRHSYEPVPPSAGTTPDRYESRLLCSRGTYCVAVPDAERYRDAYGGESWYFRASAALFRARRPPRRAPPRSARSRF